MYTTEKRLRDHVLRNAAMTGVEPRADVLDRWVRSLAVRLRKERRLLSERQYADHKAGRRFVVGDYARYVGPDRVEAVGDTTVTRAHGQAGRIIEAQRNDDGTQIVTFRPLLDPLLVDQHVVELVVREGTPGYWDLERDPHRS